MPPYKQSAPPITGYVNRSYILCLEDSGLFTALWVSCSLEYTAEGYYRHRWGMWGCEVEGVGEW